MSATPSINVIQVCHTCGGGAPVDAHFCPQCSKILSLGKHGDYFAFLGVPRKLNFDASLLEQRFRTLSRSFHPDYFYNATPAERRASLERSSYLNDAYRTLKQPASRIGYLLELEGMMTAKERGHSGGAGHVPPALLEEVFALNEELDEVRALKMSDAPETVWRAKLEQAERPILAKRDEHEEQLRTLSARWDALVDTASASEAERREVLEGLRDCMLERNYINNLLDTIERERLVVPADAGTPGA